MTHAKILAAVLAVAAAVPARAGLEAASAAADHAFFQAAFSAPLPALNPAVRARRPGFPAPMAAVSESPVRQHEVVLVSDAPQGSAAEAASIDLAALLNRQLKSSLRYDLGGKSVWISGAFDRSQNAYVSILVDGSEAKFFNVKGLLDKEAPVEAGANKYKLYLAPNVINQMKSEIVLENAADEDDKVRVTLKKMLDAVGAAGASVTVSGQAYKVFYTDDIKNGQIDKSAKTLTFIHTDAAGEIHVFLIPADLVPSDKIAVFKMHQNLRVGLSQKDGKLKVYENP